MDRTIEKNVEAITRAYERLPKPVLLSSLGLELKNNRTPVSGLKHFIREHMDGYKIVQHPEISEKTALTTEEEEATVLELLRCSGRLSENEDLAFLSKFDRKFLFAFCVDPERSAYLTEQPLWRHNEPPSGKTTYEITPDDKYSAYLPQKIYMLNHDAAVALATKIRAWLEKHNLKAERFFKGIESVKDAKSKESDGYKRVLNPLLVRFIDAQPEAVRKQIVIPLDFLN